MFTYGGVPCRVVADCDYLEPEYYTEASRCSEAQFCYYGTAYASVQAGKYCWSVECDVKLYPLATNDWRWGWSRRDDAEAYSISDGSQSFNYYDDTQEYRDALSAMTNMLGIAGSEASEFIDWIAVPMDDMCEQLASDYVEDARKEYAGALGAQVETLSPDWVEYIVHNRLTENMQEHPEYIPIVWEFASSLRRAGIDPRLHPVVLDPEQSHMRVLFFPVGFDELYAKLNDGEEYEWTTDI
jgi:hypothetical protein